MTQRDWREIHREKVRTAGEAVGAIADGATVFIGSGGAAPASLVDALAGSPVRDCRVVHILTLGPAPYAEAALADRFRHEALFVGPNVREAAAAGRADYTPVFLSEVPELFRSRRIALDAALIQVAPPDDEGSFSLGISVDVVQAAVESAPLVIAEVNPRMPWTHGDTRIGADRIDLLVPVDAPIPELRGRPADEAARRIGSRIAALVPDGATLQIGIGAIPDAVLGFLEEKKDLGIHTEMLTEGIIPLVEAGVITGRLKAVHPGRIVAAFALGSRRLYEAIDGNPLFEFHPVDHTNDPFLIAQNDRVVAINSALEVDLAGQACADSIGPVPYSGIGGQVDFLRGAARSREGLPILALPSTAKGGSVSRIVPRLRPGAGVVTSRGDVHWVVTEHGAVDLHGMSLRERARALIEIAHPRFRRWLAARASTSLPVPV